MTMKMLLSIFALCLLFSCSEKSPSSTHAKSNSSNENIEKADYAIVIHGGAGTILKSNMSDEMEANYIKAMNEALDKGENILKNGGTAMDAVEQTIWMLEDSPLFNAGKGAVFTHDGHNELDAAMMAGIDQNAGSVGGVRTVKHPISAARAVLEKSDHVLLTSSGADDFAKEQGLDIVDPSHFHTERRWNSLQRILEEEKLNKKELSELSEHKHGTVGCVALDKAGNIVAGTSTGGMTNKRYNRFGDVPIIGAGTYADNNTCGVSCTGHGEYFIRYAVAHDVSARMEYLGESVGEAAEYVVNKKLVEKKGSGGLIALDAKGNVTMPFNSKGMYRGYAKPGERVVKIYEE